MTVRRPSDMLRVPSFVDLERGRGVEAQNRQAASPSASHASQSRRCGPRGERERHVETCGLEAYSCSTSKDRGSSPPNHACSCRRVRSPRGGEVLCHQRFVAAADRRSQQKCTQIMRVSAYFSLSQLTSVCEIGRGSPKRRTRRLPESLPAVSPPIQRRDRRHQSSLVNCNDTITNMQRLA